MRARPVTTLVPNRARSSRNSRSSTTSVMTRRTSYDARPSLGTAAAAPRLGRLAWSLAATAGGVSWLLGGRWSSRSATTSNASSRSSTTRSATPVRAPWTHDPPSRSASRVAEPVMRADAWGPLTKAVARAVITTTSARPSTSAVPPRQGPSTTSTSGHQSGRPRQRPGQCPPSVQGRQPGGGVDAHATEHTDHGNAGVDADGNRAGDHLGVGLDRRTSEPGDGTVDR